MSISSSRLYAWKAEAKRISCCIFCLLCWFFSGSSFCKNLCNIIESTLDFGVQPSSLSSLNSGGYSQLSLSFRTHFAVARCASSRPWGDKRHSARILVICWEWRICPTSSTLLISWFALSSFFNFDRWSALKSALQSTFEARVKQVGSSRICCRSKCCLIRIKSALETFWILSDEELTGLF